MKDLLLGRLALALPIAALLFAAGCADKQERKTAYFDKGMDLFEAGNYVKARLEFKNVLQIDPTDARGFYMFGQIEEREQDFRKAYALYLRAVELDPQHTDANLRLGRLYALSGQPEKALQTADLVLSRQSDHLGGLLLKSLALARSGDKQGAIAVAERALQTAPGDAESIGLLAALLADQGRLGEAIRFARQGVEIDPERVGSHLLLAQLQDKAADTDGAIAALEAVVSLAPGELTHRARLAGYYNQKGLRDQARDILEKAVTELDGNDEAKLVLVTLLKEQGDLAAAEQRLRDFVAAAPDGRVLQMALANLLIDSGRTDEAKQVLNRLIESAANPPQQAEARTRLAALLLTEQDSAGALAQVEQVLADDRKNPEALLVRGAISLQQEEPDRGIADLRTLLREDPGHVRALRLKARAHIKKGELPLARQALEAAVEAQPQETGANLELADLLVQTGDHGEALALLDKMRRFSPDNLFVLSAIGKVYAAQARWSDLEPLAAELGRSHPDKALGHYYRGLALQGQGEFEASLVEFEAALAREPNAVEPLVALARSLLRLDRPDDALRRVSAVVAQSPDHFLAHNLAGEILLSQARYAEADAAFQAANKASPGWPAPYRNRAHLALREGDTERALVILREGLDQTKAPTLGVDLAVVLQQAGRPAEAVALYERLLAADPAMLVAANNLAMLLVEGDSPSQADLDRALALAERFELQDEPKYLDTLGWVYFKRGEYAKALPVLERAAAGGESIAEIDYHLAEVYAALGRRQDALKALERLEASGAQFSGMEGAAQLIAMLRGQ